VDLLVDYLMLVLPLDHDHILRNYHTLPVGSISITCTTMCIILHIFYIIILSIMLS
jgi:hypothetical protein